MRNKTRTRKPKPIAENATQHRLALLAAAFTGRGMQPDEAHKKALYYVQGPGRGRTWIRALAEYDGSAAGKTAIVEEQVAASG